MPRLVELTVSEDKVTGRFISEDCRFESLQEYIKEMSERFNLEFKPLDDLYIFGKKIGGITGKDGIFPVAFSHSFYARKGDKIIMLSPDMTQMPDEDAYLLCEGEGYIVLPSEERDIIHYVSN